MNPILLDTHAAIWTVLDELPETAARAVASAALRDELLLSPITAWELGNLVRKKRLKLAMALPDYVRTLYARPGMVTASLTPEIALASVDLPGAFHADPADRMLIATAAAYGAKLMTRDRAILDYAKKTKHIRCIAC